jgi:hypothetical protein
MKAPLQSAWHVTSTFHSCPIRTSHYDARYHRPETRFLRIATPDRSCNTRTRRITDSQRAEVPQLGNETPVANSHRSHPPEHLRPGEADSLRRHSDDNPFCRPVTFVPCAGNVAAYLEGLPADETDGGGLIAGRRSGRAGCPCLTGLGGAGSESPPTAEPTVVPRTTASCPYAWNCFCPNCCSSVDAGCSCLPFGPLVVAARLGSLCSGSSCSAFAFPCRGAGLG